jgi:predicted nucleotidyltransferase
MDLIKKAIISTLVYGETRQWSFTAWEIFRYLTNPNRIEIEDKSVKISLRELISCLDYLKENGIISEKNGFYFLRSENPEKNIKKRITSDKISDLKAKLILRKIRYLSCLPFIKGIFLSGSLVFGWSSQESDIDLLIVTEKKRIWTARFFLSGCLALFGMKRTKKRVKNKLCLNHFISSENLQVTLYSLYNAETYARLVPLWLNERLLWKFIGANSWIKNYVFWGFGKYYGDSRYFSGSYFQIFIQKIFEITIQIIGIGPVLEKLLKFWQIDRIKKDPLTNKEGGRVSFNNAQIEFHPNSPEKETIDFYNNKLKSIGLFSFKPEKNSGLKM